MLQHPEGPVGLPGPVESLADAHAWCTRFFQWYNTEHHHRSLATVTPAQRHAGLHTQVLAERAVVKARCLAERRAYNTRTLAALPATEATSVA